MNDEHPIIFSGPMVRAILAGRKTQTRRPVKVLCHSTNGKTYKRPWTAAFPHPRFDRCPYGKPGDRLWVREACRGVERESDGCDGVEYLADSAFLPAENTEDGANLWWDLAHYAGRHSAVVPSIHMPRWASRLTLRVVSVRVERVQDISEADIRAEGVACSDCVPGGIRPEHCGCRSLFENLWNEIYEAKGQGWDANPWVWVVEFRKVEN